MKMKKFLSLILALVFVACLVPINVLAATVESTWGHYATRYTTLCYLDENNNYVDGETTEETIWVPYFSFSATPNSGGDSSSVDKSLWTGRRLLGECSTEKGADYQAAYDKLYEAIEAGNTMACIYDSKLTLDEAKMVYDAYQTDHPEHFWRTPQFYYSIYDSYVDYLQVVTYFSGDELTAAKAKFEDAKDSILSGINSNMTDYEKEKYIYDAIAKQSEYDLSSVYLGYDYDNQTKEQYETFYNAHSAYGILVNGLGVCDSYARVFEYLLREVGIECYYVTGLADGGSHAWNIVKLDGEWYYCDLTWDDQGNNIENIFYTYFNVDDDTMSENSHVLECNYATDDLDYYDNLPACTGTKYSYFAYNSTSECDLIADESDLTSTLKNSMIYAITHMTDEAVRIKVNCDSTKFQNFISENIVSIQTATGISGLSAVHGCSGDTYFLKPSTSNEIHGDIAYNAVTASDKPVTVSLINSSNTVVQTQTCTRFDSSYVFYDVAVGKYTVKAEKSGCETETYSVEVTESNSNIRQDIYLGTSDVPHIYNQRNIDDTYLKTAATTTSPAVYYYSCLCGATSKGTTSEKTFEYGSELFDGTVTLTGTGEIGTDLTVSLTNTNNSGVLNIYWYADGTQVKMGYSFDSSGYTYTPTSSDKGKKITVKVTSTKQEGELYSSNAITVIDKHTCVYDQEVATDTYLKDEATATTEAVYYKSCTCGASSKGTAGEATFKGDKLKFSVTVTNGTATPSTNVYSGEKVTITAGDAPEGKVFEKWVVTSGTVNLESETSATTTFTMPSENVSVKATYKYTGLTGTAIITGNPVYGETLKVIVSGSNNTGTLKYSWKCGDKELGTDQTYTLTQSDIGTTIYCVVTSTNQRDSLSTAATDTVKKANNTNLVTGISASNGTLSGLTTAMEYKLEGDTDWTKCEGSTVSGLSAGKYYIRYAETETHFASDAIEKTVDNHTHAYNKKVTTSTYLKSAATCTNAAVYYYSCECGECGTTTFTNGSALGHNYVNGYCSRCKLLESGITGANNRLFASGVTATRYYGDTRYKTCLATAEALKTAYGVSKFDNIVVVAGFNFPDALSATYLAAQLKAPIIMVNTQNSSTDASGNINYVINNFSKSGKIYLIGGTAAISTAVEKTLINNFTSSKVERIYGQDRYETNAKVLQRTKELGLMSSYDLLVCSGAAFPDALSCSGLGKPIMLVNGGNATSLTYAQRSFVSKASYVYIIGGNAAVNSTLESAIKKCGNLKTRLSGNDRYETSQKIANYFCSSSQSVVLASGLGFADGLCGGSLAYALGAPVVLTCNATINGNSNTNYSRAKSVVGSKKVVILGGSASLDNSTAQKIKSASVKENKYN